MLAGHDSGDIRLWDLDTGSSQTLKQHTNSVTSVVLALLRKSEELLISGEAMRCLVEQPRLPHVATGDCLCSC